MTTKILVLDHGFVRLVSYMQPAEDTRDPLEYHTKPGWTGDLEIVRNARVSYDADWRTGADEGSDDRLVRRLHARGHTSPFEAMVFTFEVQAPIFVFRQWHRHRTWSYNELSARYAPMKELFYVPKPEEIGRQAQKEKQAREIPDDLAPKHYEEVVVPKIRRECEDAFVVYKQLLQMGVPRELARGVLPVNTYSRMFATVNLHNLFRFLTLRLDKHAQYEIRVYAEALLTLARSVCPIAVEAFETELADEGTPFNPIKIDLTPEERKALSECASIDLDVNADDDLSEEEQFYYDKLRSALEKLK